MSSFHIIGTGACGFLRMNYILRDHIPLRYKGGRGKYQNSFENWSDNELIWDSENLSKEERLRRVSLQGTTTNITHSYIKYIPEFVELYPDIKFLCLKGEKEHSINSLAVSWGYNNPCYIKDRSLGVGHNRYAVEQFPNYSDSLDEFDATKKYWEEYYHLAEQYSDNLILVDAPKFFSDIEYSTDVLSKVGINVGNKTYMPVNFNSWDITTTLHGGLGNNLFQMGETISFCKKYNLPDPFFGTWDLWDGGDKYPLPYNADRLLGGHDGGHQQIESAFINLNWRRNLEASFDTKFMINDMFRFGRVDELDYIRETLSTTETSVPNTASLHLRFCTRGADDHVNGYVDDSFYIECLKRIPETVLIFIFSDDNQRAREKMKWFDETFPHAFVIIEDDAFLSLKMMVECEYHILHVSTFSFWSAFLDTKQPNSKVFYPKSFTNTHSSSMIPYKEWQMI